MKTLNRNTEEKKRLKTTFSNESHWSYFGSDFDSQFNSNSRRNDQATVSQRDYKLNPLKNQLFVKNRECTFIVDWQIDDVK